MTKDEIIRMARDAGFDPRYCSECFDILKFAALIAAQAAAASASVEREACAKVCDEIEPPNLYRIRECAAAIRARGEASIRSENK